MELRELILREKEGEKKRKEKIKVNINLSKINIYKPVIRLSS
jgi:hypothetical protein